MPSSAQSVSTRVIFDYITDTAGKGVKGAQVNCVLNCNSASVTSPIVNVGPVQQTTTTDTNGYWQLGVNPNDTLTPSGTVYTIQTPYNSYDISVPSGATPVQTSSILVNQPSVLSPATTNLTGPITVTGNESVTGNLTVSGTTTLGSTTTGALTTTGAESVGGDLTIASAFRLLFGATASKIIPGVTSLSLRNHADSADNLLVTDAGAVTTRAGLTVTSGGATVTAGGLTVTAGDAIITAGRLLLSAAAAKIKGGVTSLSLRNNADSADNVLVADAGTVTLRNALSIPPSAGGSVAPTSYGSTFVKIDEKILGGLATSWPAITIPAGFRGLLIFGKAQGNAATVDVSYQFNGDTAANYAYLQVFNLGAGPAGGASSTTTSLLAVQAQSGSSATWASYIGLPSDTTLTNKPCISIGGGAGIVIIRGGYWNNSGAAITTLQGFGSVNMVAGSFIEVYGIP